MSSSEPSEVGSQYYTPSGRSYKDGLQASVTPPPPPPPDRNACKLNSKGTPNGRVWAHRICDLRRDRNDEYWSPSMVKDADKQHTYNPSYQDRIFGKMWQQYDEPEPRKLRIWPVLTVAAGVECNEELQDLKDECLLEELPRDNKQVPKLEQRIARDLLPQILRVEDPGNRTRARAEGEDLLIVEYRRVYPPPAPLDSDSDAPLASAYLNLSDSIPRIGQGSHANVYSAHLTLDERFRLATHQPTPESVEPATVRVAAKIPFGNDDDVAMLEHEARMYDAFPEHLSEDWSGFNAIGEATYDSLDSHARVPVTAVVPKFYGYFVPREDQSEEASGARPILLIEECGNPIDPKDLTTEQRMICWAFSHRLVYEDFIQNSFYARNILVQPGPLTHPPDQRSLETPSFRLIDFGRCQRWCDLLAESRKAAWKELVHGEREMAKDTIFGKVCTFMHGHNKWYEGRYQPAYRIQKREWLFGPYDPHHHWQKLKY